MNKRQIVKDKELFDLDPGVAPRNRQARIKGELYTNPRDPSDILEWDGDNFIRVTDADDCK